MLWHKYFGQRFQRMAPPLPFEMDVFQRLSHFFKHLNLGCLEKSNVIMTVKCCALTLEISRCHRTGGEETLEERRG